MTPKHKSKDKKWKPKSFFNKKAELTGRLILRQFGSFAFFLPLLTGVYLCLPFLFHYPSESYLLSIHRLSEEETSVSRSPHLPISLFRGFPAVLLPPVLESLEWVGHRQPALPDHLFRRFRSRTRGRYRPYQCPSVPGARYQ